MIPIVYRIPNHIYLPSVGISFPTDLTISGSISCGSPLGDPNLLSQPLLYNLWTQKWSESLTFGIIQKSSRTDSGLLGGWLRVLTFISVRETVIIMPSVTVRKAKSGAEYCNCQKISWKL